MENCQKIKLNKLLLLSFVVLEFDIHFNYICHYHEWYINIKAFLNHFKKIYIPIINLKVKKRFLYNYFKNNAKRQEDIIV